MIVIDVLAAVGYLPTGEWRRVVYWLAAGCDGVREEAGGGGMSRRPTKAYRLYTGHSLEELTALMVEAQDPALSTELARAIQWKLDERNLHG